MLELAGNYSHRIAYKVNNPYSVTFLIGTPILEWCVVWCGSKNGYQNHRAENMIIILGSLVNILGGGLMYDHLMSSQNQKESGYNLNLDLLTMLYLSFVSYSRRGGLVGNVTHLP